MSAKQLFFQELKLQYEKELELKNRLDGKANNIITVSGTVAKPRLVLNSVIYVAVALLKALVRTVAFDFTSHYQYRK